MGRSEQLEEVAGFECMLECFSGGFMCDKEADPIVGTIRIDFPPLDKRLTVVAHIDDDLRYRTVGVLSSCYLHFTLPAEYPSCVPEWKLECPWLSEDKLSELNARLAEVAASNLDCPMLYSFAFTIQEEACTGLEGTELRVDNTPYAEEKGLSGEEMLQTLTHASEIAELEWFERACHDCEVCLENESGLKSVKFRPCGHIFCMRCVETYFSGLLKSEAVRAFECLSEGCSSLAAQETVKKAIGQEQFDRYEKILLERALDSMDDMVVCPRPNCGKFVAVNPLNVFAPSNTRSLAQCDACSYAFCILCRKAYHGLDQCTFQSEEKAKLLAQYESGENRSDLVKRAGGEKELEKIVTALKNDQWITENSKPCPKCKANIEKTTGCNKMKCTKCSTCFCWLCLKKLDGDPYKHFGEGNCANRLFEGAVEAADGDPYGFHDEDDDEFDFDDDEVYDPEDDEYPDYEGDDYDPEDVDYDDPEVMDFLLNGDGGIPAGVGAVVGFGMPVLMDVQRMVGAHGEHAEGAFQGHFDIGTWEDDTGEAAEPGEIPEAEEADQEREMVGAVEEQEEPPDVDDVGSVDTGDEPEAHDEAEGQDEIEVPFPLVDDFYDGFDGDADDDFGMDEVDDVDDGDFY